MNDNEPPSEWEVLYERVRGLMLQFGSEDHSRTADCWVDDDDIGTDQQKIYVRNLELLPPVVVDALRALLTGEFAGWEIVVAVAVPGAGEAWPEMGLTIRRHEIIDGLQRQYFPAALRDLAYADARPGTDKD
jgi:hypothetical protein